MGTSLADFAKQRQQSSAVKTSPTKLPVAPVAKTTGSLADFVAKQKQSGDSKPVTPEISLWDKAGGLVKTVARGLTESIAKAGVTGVNTVAGGIELAKAGAYKAAGNEAKYQEKLDSALKEASQKRDVIGLGEVGPVDIGLLKADKKNITYAGNQQFSKGLLETTATGADIAFNLSLGGITKGGVKAVAAQPVKNFTKKELTQASSNAIKEYAKQKAKELLFDFTVGTGAGAAMELQNNPEATLPEVTKTALTTGVTNVVLPRVLGAGTKVLGAGAKVVGKEVGKTLESAAQKLEAKSAVALPEKARFYQQVSEVKPTFAQKAAGKTAEVIRSAQKAPDFLKTQFTNRFDAVNKFDKTYEEVTGKKSKDLGDMVQRTSYVGAGKAANKLDDYKAIQRKYGNNWGLVKEYSHYLDDADRLAMGQEIAAKSGSAERQGTLEEVRADLLKMKQSMTPEQFANVEKGQKDLQAFLRQELLDAKESGRLTEAGYNTIVAAHPNYIPHDVLDFLDEMPQGVGKSLNVSKSGIEKAKGSQREIIDIDEAIANRLYRNSVLNEKNKTIDAIVSAGKESSEKLGFVPQRTAEGVTKRQAAFQAIRDKKAVQEQNMAAVQELKGLEQKAKGKIKEISALPAENRAQKGLAKRIKEHNQEINSLMDEAQTLASEFDAPHKIDDILNKVDTRDKKIADLTERLQKETEAYNASNVSDIKRQTDSLNRVKATRKEIDKLVEEGKAEMKDMYASLKDLRDLKTKKVDYAKEGYEKISYFKNGIREDWLVPKDLGYALKNIDNEQAGKIMEWINNSKMGKFLTAPARFTRAVSTSLNPVFTLISNPARDLQTATVTSNAGYRDFAKSAADGLINIFTRGKGDDELYRLARESGALQGSIFREGLTGKQIMKKETQKTGFWSRVSHPINTMENVGQKTEEFTRMTVFKKALEDGLSPTEAAKVARNSTVDFGRYGNTMQAVNKFIPFLNARIQGGANLLKTLAKDPTTFYRKMMLSAAYPTALLYNMNKEYKSYQQIPDNERRKYWIIMVGESKGKDIKGKPTLIPHYIKIPKGEAQQAVSSVLERVLNKSREKYPDTTAEFLGKLAKDISPVTEASLIPPGFSQLYETKSNYSMFREKQIEPDYIKQAGKWMETKNVKPEYRYNDSTSEVAKAMGKALGWSPIKIDYVIKMGILNDFIRGIDIPIKGFKGKSAFEKTAEIPFIRSVLGTSAYGLDLKKQAVAEQKKTDKNTKKIERYLERKKSE